MIAKLQTILEPEKEEERRASQRGWGINIKEKCRNIIDKRLIT